MTKEFVTMILGLNRCFSPSPAEYIDHGDNLMKEKLC